MEKTADIKVAVDFQDLNALAREVHETAVARGWWSEYGAGAPHADHDPTFGETLMLVVTEVAEAMEAFREGGNPAELSYTYEFDNGPTGYKFRKCDHPGKGHGLEYCPDGWEEAPEAWKPLTPDVVRSMGGNIKPTGVPSELADIIIRVLDISGAWGVDIAEALRVKMEFNKTRKRKHGGKRL